MVNRKTRRLNRKVSRRTRKIRRTRKVRRTRKIRRSRKQRGGNVDLLTLGTASIVAAVIAADVINSQYYTDFKARRVLKNYKHGPGNMRSATL